MKSDCYINYCSTIRLACVNLILIVTLSGCLRTSIEPHAIDETVQLLALTSADPLFFNIQDADELGTIGHQYLFFGIPFGRVQIEDSGAYFSRSFFTEIALAGKKPLIAVSSSEQYPVLDVRIKDVQATAYDLFAIRWIQTEVNAEVEYKKSPTESYSRNFLAKESAFKRFAFGKQLSFYFSKTVKKLTEDILKFINECGDRSN